MKAERITHWDGIPLIRAIDIFWWFNKEYKGMSLKERFYRRVSNLYYRVCWELYDHTNLFNHIPEARRFSWGYLRRR